MEDSTMDKRTILEAILTAQFEAEKMLKQAKIARDCCEAETDETQGLVMYAENVYLVNNSIEASIELDRAYKIHDKACQDYYNACEDVRELETIIQLMDKASYHC
jgi:hypothetical protein